MSLLPLLLLGLLGSRGAAAKGPRWPSQSHPPPARPRKGKPGKPAPQRGSQRPSAPAAPAPVPAPPSADAAPPWPPAPAPVPPVPPPPSSAEPARLSVPVLEVQKVANGMGYRPRLVQDGLFGPKTVSAWRQLARARGLSDTIVRLGPRTVDVDRATYARLNASRQVSGGGLYIP